MGPTQPRIQWVPKTLFHEVKRSGREAAEVKKIWIYKSTPPIRLHGVVLDKLITGTVLLLANSLFLE
jgi:hypothetical protein